MGTWSGSLLVLEMVFGYLLLYNDDIDPDSYPLHTITIFQVVPVTAIRTVGC